MPLPVRVLGWGFPRYSRLIANSTVQNLTLLARRATRTLRLSCSSSVTTLYVTLHEKLHLNILLTALQRPCGLRPRPTMPAPRARVPPRRTLLLPPKLLLLPRSLRLPSKVNARGSIFGLLPMLESGGLVSTEWTERPRFFDQELRHPLGKRATTIGGAWFLPTEIGTEA